MPRTLKLSFFIYLILISHVVLAHDETGPCETDLTEVKSAADAKAAVGLSSESLVQWLKRKAIDKTLDAMAIYKGLPKYLKRNDELRTSGLYRDYRNFGELGLAEMGISVRFNQKNVVALNTGRPLIIIANHHLGIADGLALQYVAGLSREHSPSLLFLARWIEKLLPYAVFGDEHKWGTAIPVEINTPKESDPLYESKMAQVKAFNSKWNRASFRVLKNGGALIIFPAGHVASINSDSGNYPASVYDAADSWQDGFLNLARLGKADIVFAHVDSVNSEAFYRNRKRFGGGDKERVIWFFSEALRKRGQNIDIRLSNPMSLDNIYSALAEIFGHSKEELSADSALTTELMRQFTYKLAELYPQTLDTKASPRSL